MKHSANKK